MPLPPELELELSRRIVDCEPRSDAEILRLVEEVLLDFGLDHAHWCETSEVRKDLHWVRDTRLRCETFQLRMIITVATLSVVALLSIIVLGFREWIQHG